jgi:methylenetetrahydrofolate dehydrogenase (NADP+)/methenyltetrahydrofolate cyclohydrolase
MSIGQAIDGRPMAKGLLEQLRRDIEELSSAGRHPGLAVLLVGDDYAARAYERRLRSIAEELGCHYVHERLDGTAAEADALAAVGKLNADPRISGVLVLRPLPDHISEEALYRILDPRKDIESVHPLNAGLLALGEPRFIPSTPAAAFHMLDQYLVSVGRDPVEFYDGATIVLVGRSNNVGKPGVWLGLERNATVISCNHHTYDAGKLRDFTHQADVLIVAAGVPGLITSADVKPGVIVIDIGINPVKDETSGKTRLVGDVDYPSVIEVAAAVSPVPGGVGPITDVWLLRNTVLAAEQ